MLLNLAKSNNHWYGLEKSQLIHH